MQNTNDNLHFTIDSIQQTTHLSSQFLTQTKIGKRDSLNNMKFLIQPNATTTQTHMSVTQSHQDLQQIIQTALLQCESATNLTGLCLRRTSLGNNNKQQRHFQSVKKLNFDMTQNISQNQQASDVSPVQGLISLRNARDERKLSKNRVLENSTIGISLDRIDANNSLMNSRPTRSDSIQLQDLKSLRDQIKIRKQNSSLSNTRCDETTSKPYYCDNNQDKLQQVSSQIKFNSQVEITPCNTNKLVYTQRNSSNRQSGVGLGININKRLEDQSPANTTINNCNDSNIVSIRNSFLTNDPRQYKNCQTINPNGFTAYSDKLESLRLCSTQNFNSQQFNESIRNQTKIVDLQKKVSTNIELFPINEIEQSKGKKQNQHNYQSSSVQLVKQKEQGVISLKKVSNKIISDSNTNQTSIQDKKLSSIKNTSKLVTPIKLDQIHHSPRDSQFNLDKIDNGSNKKQQLIFQRITSKDLEKVESQISQQRNGSKSRLDDLLQKFGSKQIKSSSPTIFTSIDHKSATERKYNSKTNLRECKTHRNYQTSITKIQENTCSSPKIKEIDIQTASQSKTIDQHNKKKKSRNQNEIRRLLSKPAQVTLNIGNATEQLFNTMDGIKSKKSHSSIGMLNIEPSLNKNQKKIKESNSQKRKNLVKRIMVNNLSTSNLGNLQNVYKTVESLNLSPNHNQQNIYQSISRHQQDKIKQTSQQRKVICHNSSNISLQNQSLDNYKKSQERTFNQKHQHIMAITTLKNCIQKDKITQVGQLKSQTLQSQLQFASNLMIINESNNNNKQTIKSQQKQQQIKQYDLPRQLKTSSSSSTIQSIANHKTLKTISQSQLNTNITQDKDKLLIKNKENSNQKVESKYSPSTKNALQMIVQQVHEKRGQTSNNLQKQSSHKENQKQQSKNYHKITKENKTETISSQNENDKKESDVKHITLIKGINQINLNQSLKSLNTSSSMSLLQGLQALMPSKKINQHNSKQIDVIKQKTKQQQQLSLKENSFKIVQTRKRWTQKMAEKIQKQVEERQKVLLEQTSEKLSSNHQSMLKENLNDLKQMPKHKHSKSNPKLLLQLSQSSQFLTATPESSQFFYENHNHSSLMPQGESRIGVNISNDFTVKMTDDSMASACMLDFTGKHSRLLTTRKQINQIKQKDFNSSKVKAISSGMGEIENILFEGNIMSTRKIKK